MEILDTVINREIIEITQKAKGTIAYKWKLIIKANGKEYEAIFIKQIRLDRLYTQNFADELTVEAGFILNDIEFGIIPYKDQLTATLVRIPMYSGDSSEPDKSLPVESNIYKVQLFDGGKQVSIEGDSPYAINKGTGSRQSVVGTTVQLISPVIDNIRKQTFGTIFRKPTTPMIAMRYVLGVVAKPAFSDTSHDIKGVTIAAGYKDEPTEHMVVKHLTPIIDVPRQINETYGGIYPTGFRYYLQKHWWFIYPIYDNTRFLKATERTLTIIKIPKYRMPTLTRTFRVTPSQVIILTTRETKMIDMSEQNQLRTGNGVRFVDASKMMDIAKIGDNKAIIDDKDNVTEVMVEERIDGSDMIMGAESRITDKFNLEYSKMSKLTGLVLQTVWEHSDVEELHPGMPVRYIFMDGEQPKELYGTLNAVETMNYPTNVNLEQHRFVEMSSLTVFLQKENPVADATKPESISKTVGN